ncbi:hypothetical protein TNCV_3587481 [Trichonephila clavipes]|nr:hypothetical protein TNCV_3587481 [Trichonephila clavipes]
MSSVSSLPPTYLSASYRAQMPPSRKETGSQNYLSPLIRKLYLNPGLSTSRPKYISRWDGGTFRVPFPKDVKLSPNGYGQELVLGMSGGQVPLKTHRVEELMQVNQLTVIDEYTRHGLVAGFCVLTSIFVMD